MFSSSENHTCWTCKYNESTAFVLLKWSSKTEFQNSFIPTAFSISGFTMGSSFEIMSSASRGILEEVWASNCQIHDHDYFLNYRWDYEGKSRSLMPANLKNAKTGFFVDCLLKACAWRMKNLIPGKENAFILKNLMPFFFREWNWSCVLSGKPDFSRFYRTSFSTSSRSIFPNRVYSNNTMKLGKID